MQLHSKQCCALIRAFLLCCCYSLGEGINRCDDDSDDGDKDGDKDGDDDGDDDDGDV